MRGSDFCGFRGIQENVEHAYQGGFGVDAYRFAGGKVGLVIDPDVVNVAGQAVEAKAAFAVGINGVHDRSPAFQANQNGSGKFGARAHFHLSDDASATYLRPEHDGKKKKCETGQERRELTSGVEGSMHRLGPNKNGVCSVAAEQTPVRSTELV